MVVKHKSKYLLRLTILFFGYLIGRLILNLFFYQSTNDDDLIALVSDVVFQPQMAWNLGDVQVRIDSQLFMLVLYIQLSQGSNC